MALLATRSSVYIIGGYFTRVSGRVSSPDSGEKSDSV